MPGAAEMSNEDSSSTITIFGRFTPGSHSVIGAACAEPTRLLASASIQPVAVRCETATTPERARLEMWLTPWNGSHGFSGLAADITTMPSTQAPAQPSAVRRRREKGSARQIAHSSGTATAAAISSHIRNCGKIDCMKEMVSRSTIRKSRKVSVSWVMPYLNCDSTISAITSNSASTALTPGRLKMARKRKFSSAQASSASVMAKGPYSTEASI